MYRPSPSHPRRLVRVALALAIGVLALMWAPPPSQAANPMQVTVTIHNVWQLDCDDNEFISLGVFETCGEDYYAKAFFPSGDATSPRAPDDKTDISPNWQLSGTFDRDGGPFGIRIQLWDHDSTSGDDLLDIAPGDDNLDITVDPSTGDFSGDVQTANIGWSTGSGDESAVIFFSVTFGPSVDLDGDGIHDGLERSAIGVDKQGRIPAGGNLRAVPANRETPGGPTVASNPCQSTVLVENDYMNQTGGATPHNHRPVQAAIDESVATFAAGDRPAPASCPYGGFSAAGGVQLLMVVDDQLAETSPVTWGTVPMSTSGESIRDGGRGDSDPANDTFDPRLRPWYSYALWADSQPGTTSSGLCCGDNNASPDILVTLGGFTAGVGDAKEQAGTFMHELGHALGLGHGGGDGNNCKPNYISIMSYTYQFSGVPDASVTPTFDINKDGTIDNRDRFRMDYSRQALIDLDEDLLSESTPMGTSTDAFFWDGDGTNPWRQGTINAPVNWDNDSPAVIDPGTVAADVNYTSNSGCTASPPTGTPPVVVELPGYDDWANLKFQAALASPGTSTGVPSSQELDRPNADLIRQGIRAAMSQADVSVGIEGNPDPVAAGTDLVYTLTARNHDATNTAYATKVEQALPADVSYVSAGAGCTHAAGVVTCSMGDLAPGATATRTVTVHVPADLVYVNGGPKTIGSTATVTHDGPDPDASNDQRTEQVQVVAVADLAVTDTTIHGPLEVLVGQSASVDLDVAVANGGPSSPMDTRVALSATADPGLSVTPATASKDVPALAVGTPRTTGFDATVTCAAPGAKTVTLTAAIAPKNAADSDPVAGNNQRTSELTIDCVVPIKINVRPGSSPNPINLNTDAVLAALTTRAGEYGLPIAFDATKIDVSKTRWAVRSQLFDTATPSGAQEMHGKGHPEDSYELDEKTRDRDLDLVLHFKPAASGLTSGTTEGCLKGKYVSPGGAIYTFFGCDSVRIVA
jgi:hypothetical protein